MSSGRIDIGSKSAPAVYKDVTASDSPLGSAITANEYEALQRAFNSNTSKGFSILGTKVGDAQSDFISQIAGSNKSLARALTTGASFFGDDGKPGYMSMRLAEVRNQPEQAGASGVPKALAERIWALRDSAHRTTSEVQLEGPQFNQYFRSNMQRELTGAEGQKLIADLRAAGVKNPDEAITQVLSGSRPR